MNYSFFITGFMGSGKTTFAQKLKAQNSELLVADLDEIVFHQFASPNFSTLGHFIESKGMPYFRECESLALKKTLEQCHNQKSIVALGGGTVTQSSNVELFRQSTSAKIVYLWATFEECFLRIRGDSNRPLLKMGEEKLQQLYRERHEIYLQLADITIQNPEKISSYSDLVHLL